MTIKDIVTTAAVCLGKTEVLEYLEKGVAENVEQVEKELNLLLRCTVLTVEQLATEYAPLSMEEQFQTENGRIYFSDFSRRVLEILSVKSLGKIEQTFKVYPEFVKTINGRVVVEYNYLPQNLKLADEISFDNGKITERIISYGVASEYALIEDCYEESVMWDERFKQSLIKAIGTKNARVKQRRWR